MAAGTSPLRMFPNMSPTQYPLINEKLDNPPYHLAKYLPPSVHTPSVHTSSTNPAAYSHTTQHVQPTIPISEFHTHTSLLTHLSKPNLFSNFLNTWAQNQDNPSLLKPPPSFHLSPTNNQAQPYTAITTSQAKTHLAKPNSTLPAHSYYPKITHKIPSCSHSHFKPYSIACPPSTIGFPPQQDTALSSQQPLLPDPITLIHLVGLPPYYTFTSQKPTQNRAYSYFVHHVVTASVESLSPQTSTQSTISYTIYAIISKGKGNSKLDFDDDDVPLALLKKQKCGYIDSSSPLSDIEVAAISLTNLQHATLIRSSVYDFLNTPLLGTPKGPNEMMPRFSIAAYVFQFIKISTCHSNCCLQQASR
jgi:hypothetical protein